MMGDIKAIKTSFWINVLFEDVFVIEGFPENSFGIIKRITLRCTRKYVLLIVSYTLIQWELL